MSKLRTEVPRLTHRTTLHASESKWRTPACLLRNGCYVPDLMVVANSSRRSYSHNRRHTVPQVAKSRVTQLKPWRLHSKFATITETGLIGNLGPSQHVLHLHPHLSFTSSAHAETDKERAQRVKQNVQLQVRRPHPRWRIGCAPASSSVYVYTARAPQQNPPSFSRFCPLRRRENGKLGAVCLSLETSRSSLRYFFSSFYSCLWRKPCLHGRLCVEAETIDVRAVVGSPRVAAWKD